MSNKKRPLRDEKSKEITPDGPANHSDSSRVISCSCWAPAFYVTSSFYRLVYIGGLTSTLDSLLFCIFILHPTLPFCKMGSSIKESPKVWRNSGFTDDLGCDMMVMLGGLQAACFVCLKDPQNKTKDQPFGWSACQSARFCMFWRKMGKLCKIIVEKDKK